MWVWMFSGKATFLCVLQPNIMENVKSCLLMCLLWNLCSQRTTLNRTFCCSVRWTCTEPYGVQAYDQDSRLMFLIGAPNLCNVSCQIIKAKRWPGSHKCVEQKCPNFSQSSGPQGTMLKCSTIVRRLHALRKWYRQRDGHRELAESSHPLLTQLKTTKYGPSCSSIIWCKRE